MNIDQKILQKRFGFILAYQEIEEPISYFYDLAVRVVQDALSPALLLYKGDLIPYPYAVGFPVRNSFNAATCDEDDGGSLLVINASVPFLIFQACLSYSVRVDTRTALPIEDNGKIVAFDSKLNIPGRLGNMPTNPATVFDIFNRAIVSEKHKNASLPFALHIYAIAIRYLAMHEVMHIVLGHTGYIKRELGLNVFSEFSSYREVTLDHNFSHCLEFLADRNAIRGIASRMLGGDYRTEALEGLLTSSEVPNEDYIIRSIVTAVSIIFHLFPSRDDALKKASYSHPHPYLRMQWVAMELGHEVGNRIDYRDSILITMAKVAATMISNFETPNNWQYAAVEDVDPTDDRRPRFTDDSYKAVVDLSELWSKKLWQGYSPIYKNDGSGRQGDY